MSTLSAANFVKRMSEFRRSKQQRLHQNCRPNSGENQIETEAELKEVEASIDNRVRLDLRRPPRTGESEDSILLILSRVLCIERSDWK